MKQSRTEYYAFHRDPKPLAIGLGVPLATLEQLARRCDDFVPAESIGSWNDIVLLSIPMYTPRHVRIKGRARTVWVPTEELKEVQRAVADFLHPAADELLMDNIHGYRIGRSTFTNALPHCGSTWVQKIDIEEFFASSSPEMVRKLFVDTLGLSDLAGDLLISLTTLSGGLPLGAPSSPSISNLLLAEADIEIARVCENQAVVYTRYADDLTFSSKEKFDMLPTVEPIIRQLGYVINQRKSILRRRGQALQVTGLVIWDGDQPRLPKRFRRRLAQELYYVEKFGIEGHAGREYDWPWIDPENDPEVFERQSEAHLAGKLRYARGIEIGWFKMIQEKHPDLIEEQDEVTWRRLRSEAFAGLVERIKNTPNITMNRI